MSITLSPILCCELADPGRPSEGECLLYEGGGVGVFGEVGVADVGVREQRWTRVVVTLGTPSQRDDGPSSATLAALSRGEHKNSNSQSSNQVNEIERYGSEGDPSDEYDAGDDAPRFLRSRNMFGQHSERRGRGMGIGGRASATAPMVPCLTTYVNSKKCSCVSSASRGVIGVKDGRFAINPDGFNLFSSSQSKYMPGE